ncbi:MAG: hypothetical protein ACR2MG_14400 [Pyrinomonadaceae bacterium]
MARAVLTNRLCQAGSGLGARVVALGDFNEDGNLDMAIGTDSLANEFYLEGIRLSPKF